MFGKSIKAILTTGILAAGIATSTTGAANAGSNFNLHVGGGHGIGTFIGHGGSYGFKRSHGYKNRYGYKRHHGFKKSKQAHRRGCSPRHALHKAYNIGLNQPHVKRVNHKKIVVVGYNRGHLAKVVFKRKGHGCKVIKTSGLY